MIAAVVAAVAALLLLGPPPQARLRVRQHPRRTGRPAVFGPALPVAAGVVLGAALHPGATGWLASIATATLTVVHLVRGQVRRRRERESARECGRAARVLASLMRSGQIPTAALTAAATDCPVLAPAAAAARIGGDIGAELERTATRPGHGPCCRWRRRGG
ncbi:hypothetical protein G7085_14530 [Tessaracoccus sp. HDW20]|uniref:hypothetical protein n=1 Tax=Tessaracoccus coleopterorum TaxID=2714950 RepID=UPI0018D2DCCD|nr:hypothetical protein [Tessaracoccus coleopterorum]NHB85423.1 hypothetical protein [Tessaracoccus coleopterorum]